MLLIIETITWKPHIETAMEIALRRQEAGDEVVYCNLRHGLPACEDASELHRLLDLPEIRVRRASEILTQHGIRFLRPDYSREQRRSAADESRELMRACTTEQELKQLRHGDYYDLGWGVISSAVSVTRDSTVSLSSHRKMLQKYCESAILVYDKACQLIDELRPSELLFFNGRFATTRAALRAAQARGIPWKIHERGGDRNRYWVTDCMPHDMGRIQDKILAAWRPEHVDAGHAFFHARRNRIERDWHSFARGQHHGRLPPEMDGDGEWVTFFTSSEDEMLAIADSYTNERYPTQIDAIQAVAEAVRSLGMRLCVRVHPHTGEKSRVDRDKWASLDLPGVVVIGPGDVTDSYALMDRSRVVCSYGSTVGIEATYWGRPSLLFSASYYERLGVCAIADSAEHVLSFLREPAVYPQERTLAYGAFWELLGEPYRHYQADSLHRGRICGVYLDDNAPMRAARMLLAPATRLLGRSH